MKEIKRVLLIDHPEADYNSAFTLLGLVKILGAENVIVFPFKESYAGKTHIYPSSYGKNSLGSREMWDDMETWADQKKGVTGPYEFFPSIPLKKYNFDELLDILKTIDLIILASPRCWVSASMSMLIRTGQRLPPCVMMDGEDSMDIRFDYIDAFDPVRYFKREYTEGMRKGAGDRFVPFPLCSYVWQSKYAEEAAGWLDLPKENDVVFILGETHPNRRKIYEALKPLTGKYKMLLTMGADGTRFNAHDYLKKLATAKIGISVRGWGEDTVRYWEIPSFKTLLLTDRLNILRPNPFIEGQTASFYSTPQECAEKVEYWLTHPEELNRVATAGYEWCMKYHTGEVRAKTLLEEAGRII